jgi:hypothetical protein
VSDEDFQYIPNPNYDPDQPGEGGPDDLDLSNMPVFMDMTRGLALTFGKRKLESLRDRKGALNDCLRLLAIHRLPPPDWLAEKMLAKLPKSRSNALTIEHIISKVTEADRLKQEEGCNKYAQADRLGMSHANLTKWRALYEAWLDKME